MQFFAQLNEELTEPVIEYLATPFCYLFLAAFISFFFASEPEHQTKKKKILRDIPSHNNNNKLLLSSVFSSFEEHLNKDRKKIFVVFPREVNLTSKNELFESVL